MKIINCEQGSPEWFEARLGKITGSLFAKLITKTGKKSAQCEDVINQLVAEIITGEREIQFESFAMTRGKELESEALDFFNLLYNEHKFAKIGFVDAENGTGCSPDAIDLKGEVGIEIKCPLAKTHVKYLSLGTVPQEHVAQVQGSMMVTGYSAWLFASYHPSMPPLKLTVERDEKFICDLREVTEWCTDQIKKRVSKIQSMM